MPATCPFTGRQVAYEVLLNYIVTDKNGVYGNHCIVLVLRLVELLLVKSEQRFVRYCIKPIILYFRKAIIIF